MQTSNHPLSMDQTAATSGNISRGAERCCISNLRNLSMKPLGARKTQLESPSNHLENVARKTPWQVMFFQPNIGEVPPSCAKELLYLPAPSARVSWVSR